ncbi:hypothetical protein [Bacillus xiapuensis]|nr:hypothetical protein [Bacillus xiapuensis]
MFLGVMLAMIRIMREIIGFASLRSLFIQGLLLALLALSLAGAEKE